MATILASSNWEFMTLKHSQLPVQRHGIQREQERDQNSWPNSVLCPQVSWPDAIQIVEALFV